jgi:methylmalonyl-CoA/ethylmalonyl-CoA epimerase
MPETVPAAPGISQIGQIAIAVRNLAQAVAFYRDVLGLPFLFEASGMAFFDCGGVRLMLTVPESPEFDHPASIVYYKVHDVQQTAAALRARGATFERDPHVVARMPSHDLWMAFLRDPDRNLLAIMSEQPRD